MTTPRLPAVQGAARPQARLGGGSRFRGYFVHCYPCASGPREAAPSSPLLAPIRGRAQPATCRGQPPAFASSPGWSSVATAHWPGSGRGMERVNGRAVGNQAGLACRVAPSKTTRPSVTLACFGAWLAPSCPQVPMRKKMQPPQRDRQ